MDKNLFLGYAGVVIAVVMVLVTTGMLVPTFHTFYTLISGVIEALTLPETGA